jgi:hypothetical protein
MKRAEEGASDRLSRHFRLACMLLGSAAACMGMSIARAQEATTFSAANQLEGWYDSENRESVLDDRFDLRVAHGPYAIGGTILSHSPSNPTTLDPNDYTTARQGIRKRWIEVSADAFALRAGNIYSTFGRGLALAIFEDQTVDFDNALDGFQASAQSERGEVEILGGSNAYNETGLVLKAARVGAALPFGWKSGLSGVWADQVEGSARLSGDRLYCGSLQGALRSYADLYGEYVMRDQRGPEGEDSRIPQGHAGYISANLYLGRVQVLGEFKDLLRYDLPTVDTRAWVNPPTCVRAHASTLLNRGAHTPNIFPADERAGLAEAYLTVAEKTKVVASYARSKARHHPYASWETYGELEQWFGETEIILRADETEDTVQEGNNLLFTEHITFGGSLVYPLPAEWNLDLTAENQNTQESIRNADPLEPPVEYSGQVATMTISAPNGMAWAVTGEWTDKETELRQNWLWLEWTLRLGERHQLNLGGGRQRGGQVCSGGVCKLVDPFQGGRIELLTNF